MDTIIKKGKVFDGTGNTWFKSDIGIKNEKISYIGDLNGESAEKVIDAKGLVVCPGFIDIHTHSDWLLIGNPTIDSKVYQGVTTELVGHCGGSAAPMIGDKAYFQRRLDRANIKGDWSTIKEYFDILNTRGHSTNAAFLIGHGNLRIAVLGMDAREPDDRELSLMKNLVAQGMDLGLFGMSTALYYTPGSFAKTEEIIELCKVVAKYGGQYYNHIRDESSGLVESIKESIRIGEESGVSVECVHHKAYGRPHWEKILVTLDLITKAREKGIDITIDVYPYIWDSGSFNGWLPVWALDGGAKELLKRLKDPATREKIKTGIEKRITDPESLISTSIITHVSKNKHYSGKKVIDIANERKQNIIDCALDILIEEEGGSLGISSQFGSEENVTRILRHPASMVSSDGSGVTTKAEGWIHPRNFGTYPRLISRYVREKGVLTLQEAIRKCTSMPAQKLGLKNRGLLREDMYADITIFDYDKIHDNFSLENPAQYAEGIQYVLVNGQLILEKGKHTGARPGKTLKRQP